MLPLNRTHKYENILNFEMKKEGKKASESSACIVHAEAHTNASCNRFIDCNLSRLSFSCVLFYFTLQRKKLFQQNCFDLSCTHRYLYRILIAYLFRHQFVYSNRNFLIESIFLVCLFSKQETYWMSDIFLQNSRLKTSTQKLFLECRY